MLEARTGTPPQATAEQDAVASQAMRQHSRPLPPSPLSCLSKDLFLLTSWSTSTCSSSLREFASFSLLQVMLPTVKFMPEIFHWASTVIRRNLCSWCGVALGNYLTQKQKEAAYFSVEINAALATRRSSWMFCLAWISLCRLDCRFKISILSRRCERRFFHVFSCGHKQDTMWWICCSAFFLVSGTGTVLSNCPTLCPLWKRSDTYRRRDPCNFQTLQFLRHLLSQSLQVTSGILLITDPATQHGEVLARTWKNSNLHPCLQTSRYYCLVILLLTNVWSPRSEPPTAPQIPSCLADLSSLPPAAASRSADWVLPADSAKNTWHESPTFWVELSNSMLLVPRCTQSQLTVSSSWASLLQSSSMLSFSRSVRLCKLSMACFWSSDMSRFMLSKRSRSCASSLSTCCFWLSDSAAWASRFLDSLVCLTWSFARNSSYSTSFRSISAFNLQEHRLVQVLDFFPIPTPRVIMKFDSPRLAHIPAYFCRRVLSQTSHPSHLSLLLQRFYLLLQFTAKYLSTLPQLVFPAGLCAAFF